MSSHTAQTRPEEVDEKFGGFFGGTLVIVALLLVVGGIVRSCNKASSEKEKQASAAAILTATSRAPEPRRGLYGRLEEDLPRSTEEAIMIAAGELREIEGDPKVWSPVVILPSRKGWEINDSPDRGYSIMEVDWGDNVVLEHPGESKFVRGTRFRFLLWKPGTKIIVDARKVEKTK